MGEMLFSAGKKKLSVLQASGQLLLWTGDQSELDVGLIVRQDPEPVDCQL